MFFPLERRINMNFDYFLIKIKLIVCSLGFVVDQIKFGEMM